MLTVTDDWYEHQNNWCGIANITAMERYAWLKYNGNSNPTYKTQESVASHLNSTAAISPWDQPNPPPRTFKANISNDFGTDPRAIAWGIWDVSPIGWYYHNWIYRTDATTATKYFASDFGNKPGKFNEPISVTVNGGQHSLIIDGVYSYNDPSYTGQSANLYSISTWDPWYNRNNVSRGGNTVNMQQHRDWPLWDWTHNSGLWGQTYNINGDPEPSTTGSNYYNAPPLAHHWGTYFITIERDTYPTGSYSPNIALVETGYTAPHN